MLGFLILYATSSAVLLGLGGWLVVIGQLTIGQLVAGIAHEINNPVNAIVNTVGPLEGAIELISSEDDSEKQEAEQD